MLSTCGSLKPSNYTQYKLHYYIHSRLQRKHHVEIREETMADIDVFWLAKQGDETVLRLGQWSR